jgi:hypothetical protein
MVLLGAGCAPKNQGVEHGKRIERRAGDSPGLLGSADLVAATDSAVESIANLPAVQDAPGKTVILMDQVFNRTSDPSADYQVFLARLRAMMNESGLGRDLVFVATRHTAEQIKAREGYPAQASARTMATYALYATVYDMPRSGSNFYYLEFKLVELATDELAWIHKYEVKL